MNRETQLYAREVSVRDRKPVLGRLYADVAVAAEQASSVARRESLEAIAASLSVSLGNPKELDVTQAEADAARAAWEVPCRR